jgi:hypothetical protein
MSLAQHHPVEREIREDNDIAHKQFLLVAFSCCSFLSSIPSQLYHQNRRKHKETIPTHDHPARYTIIGRRNEEITGS